MIMAGIGCRTGVSAEAVVSLLEEAISFLVMRGLVPRIYPLGRPDGDWAPQGVGPRNKSVGDDEGAVGDEKERADASITVMRGLVPRIYPLGRPDGDWAPQGVGPRNKSVGDEEGDGGDEIIAALAVPVFRQGEPGIAEAASRLNLPILWVEHDALKGEQGRCLTRSARAEAEVGLSCVAEAAALFGAGPGSVLLLPRILGGGVTCALAEGPGR